MTCHDRGACARSRDDNPVGIPQADALHGERAGHERDKAGLGATGDEDPGRSLQKLDAGVAIRVLALPDIQDLDRLCT